MGNQSAGMASGAVSPADVEKLNQSYLKIQAAGTAERGARLDRELAQLDLLAGKYQSTAQRAAEEVGLDVEAMRDDFTKATEGADAESAADRFREVLSRWQDPLSAAVAATGIDPSQGRTDALNILGDDVQSMLGATGATGKADGTGLIGVGYSIDDYYAPPKEPAPAPSFTQTALSAPYTLSSAVGGATANPANGQLYSYNWVDVGSNQQLASVGSTFYADPTVRRVRIESIVDVSYGTLVMACLGYASAETLLNLKVLDGTQLMGSSRLSLARSIGAVFWASSIDGSGAYMLSCEFNHSYGTPRNYAAIVELETWAGGGGLFVVCPSRAYGYGAPRGINVTLIR
jgi:hypothetical protein